MSANPLKYQPEPPYEVIEQALSTIKGELPKLVKLNNDLHVAIPEAERLRGLLTRQNEVLEETGRKLRGEAESVRSDIATQRRQWDELSERKRAELLEERAASHKELDERSQSLDTRQTAVEAAERDVQARADELAGQEAQAHTEAEKLSERGQELDTRVATLAEEREELEQSQLLAQSDLKEAAKLKAEALSMLERARIKRDELEQRQQRVVEQEQASQRMTSALNRREADISLREEAVDLRQRGLDEKEAELTKREIRLEDRETTVSTNMAMLKR